jgi:hypothetical protein
MPTGPFTKLRAEDQIRGHRLDLGGLFGDDQPGIIHLHESALGLGDAALLVDGQVQFGSIVIGGSGLAGSLLINESIPGANDANLDVRGDTTIYGDLDVKGAISFIESLIIKFKDPNLTLNADGTDLTADGGGLTIGRATAPFPSLIWKNSFNAWACGVAGAEKEITTEGNTFNSANTLCKLNSDSKIPIYASNTYVHPQLLASSSWVISHGMKKRPGVHIVTSAGDEVIGDVSYVDDDNLVVNFAAPFSGKAYCN